MFSFFCFHPFPSPHKIRIVWASVDRLRTSIRAATSFRVPPPRWAPSSGCSRAKGGGCRAALNWFDTDVDGEFAGVNGELGELRVRPLLGGVGYTLRHDRLRTTFSLVAGPAWNRLEIRDDVRDAFTAAGRGIDDTLDAASFVVRPGVGLSYRLVRRVDLTAFGGYMFNRPKFDVPTRTGETRNDWSADAVVLSVGAVFIVF